MKTIHLDYEKALKVAYHKGLLHGLNASSMARVKKDVMEFEDYEWNLEDG